MTLHDKAYEAAKAVLEKKAGILTKATLGAWLVNYMLPVLTAGAVGSGIGYGIHKMNRRIDPSIADSSSVDDLRNVEHLKRVKYYKQLLQSIDSGKEDSGNGR